MNRFAASILAIGLIAAIGTASAQQQGYPPIDDRYSAQPEGAYSDYARVTRVDPVLRSGYGSTETSSGRCYSDDDAYTDRRYDDRYGGRYGNSDRNRYSDRGYDDRTEGRRYEDRYANTQGTETGRNVSAVLGGIIGAALPSVRWSAASPAVKSTRPPNAIVSPNRASPSATRCVKAVIRMRATMSPPMT